MLSFYRFKDIADLYASGQEQKARHLLMEMQARYIELCGENASLRTKVREFEDILYFSKNLFFENDCYWLLTGSIKQGPFCRHCYDWDGTLYRLEMRAEQLVCTNCGQVGQREIPVQDRPVAQPAPRAARVLPFRKMAQA